MKAIFSNFYGNIKDLTLENIYYRRVLSTTPTQQLVVMSLNPKEEIGLEVHPYITQFIRIEQGKALAVMDDTFYELEDDDVIVIPPNTLHNIANVGKNKLKLYTIYSPPNHSYNRIDITKPLND